MAENTKIEWADHTQNFWIGCMKVSKACDHCYAEVSTPSRTMKVGWGSGVPRHRTAPSTWAMPKKWNDQHEAFYAKHGRRQRVFALSLGDWLDNEVPIGWLADMLQVVLIDTPNLDWLLLSKRIGNARRRLQEALDFLHKRGRSEDDALIYTLTQWLRGDPPPNVWLGITVCDQPEADRDIHKLLQVPAAKRFLSMEPLLGPVDLTRVALSGGLFDSLRGGDVGRSSIVETWPGLDWVIVGGESGPGARPMHPDWARSLRDQCQAAGVAYLFKQWGEWLPVDYSPDASEGRAEVSAVEGCGELPREGSYRVSGVDGQAVVRVGKKAAGRLLDGRTWDGFPT